MNSQLLHDLTPEASAYIWLDIHEREFQDCKQRIFQHILLTTFDLDMDTFFQTDGSMAGLGFTLLERDR